MKKYTSEDAAVIDAKNSINQAYKTGREIIEKLGDNTDWLHITKITKEGILIIYDALFEFVYPDDVRCPCCKVVLRTNPRSRHKNQKR